VAGALTERDFVAKLETAGFRDVDVLERSAMGVENLALYPLFTPDLLDLMRQLIPRERQDAVGVAVVVRARLPEYAHHLFGDGFVRGGQPRREIQDFDL
jgi:arsenite methyltransferase